MRDTGKPPESMISLTIFVAFPRAKSVSLHLTLVAFCSQVIEPASNLLSVRGSERPDFDILGFGVRLELLKGQRKLYECLNVGRAGHTSVAQSKCVHDLPTPALGLSNVMTSTHGLLS